MNGMTPKEIERKLGLQYAEALKESPHAHDVYRDCQAVIENSLHVMEHYNRIAIAMKGALGRGKSNRSNAFITS